MNSGGNDLGERRAAPPLFRPQALAEPDLGDAFAFAVPGWRSLVILLSAALVLFLGFAAFATFDRIVHVPGIVVPVSGVSRIVAPRSGVIAEVLARQGETVARGQPLLRIASTDVLPSGAGAQAHLVESFRRQLALSDESRRAERERRASEKSGVSNQLAQLGGELRSIRSQLGLQRERVGHSEVRLARIAPLRDKGYVSDVTFLDQQERVLSLRQQLASLEQREIETVHALDRARLRLAELNSEARKAELESSASRLELERGAAGAEIAAEVTITAPVAGVLSAVRTTSGASVAASENLATIVQSGDQLEALLLVPARSAGALEPGQSVTLRFDAFPYQRHGVGHGVITQVASTASTEGPDQRTGYRVRVRLVDPERFRLRPDMGLIANITVENRSLLDRIAAPLRETLRERQRSTGT
jgi:membrane fusion protein